MEGPAVAVGPCLLLLCFGFEDTNLCFYTLISTKDGTKRSHAANLVCAGFSALGFNIILVVASCLSVCQSATYHED